MARILAALVAFALTGCVFSQKPVRHVAESPSLVVAPGGQVEMKGDTPVQPKVNTATGQSRITIPEGSRIEFNEKLGTMTFWMPKAAEFVSNSTQTAIEGPSSFTPDKAPSVKEEMDAKSDFWTVLGLRSAVALGVFAIIFGMVKDWNLVMYGGIGLAGAGLFGLFVQRHPILLAIMGIGVAAAVIGPTLWHTKIKKLAVTQK